MNIYPYAAIIALLFGALLNTANAADLNGYTSQYECRAGNPNCDVDVVALGNRSCHTDQAQIITAAMPWSSIDWSSNTTCLEAGDHTWKGTLTLQASGSTGAPRVLRYYRAGDNDDEPWNQSGDQARIYAINTNSSDYWIIHRLTVDPAMGQTVGVWVGHGTTNVILNRMYITRTDGKGVQFIGSANTSDTNNNTIQNSVVAHMQTRTDAQENDCIGNSWATNTRIVNNELFDCNKSTSTGGSYALSAGIVAENNDMWDSRRTDCNGNDSATGECGRTEAFVSWKSGGTAANPAQLLHNRMFGGRHTDGALAQAGDFIAISLSAEFNDPAGASYVLVQNNIVTESEGGIVNYYGGPDHNSVVGNLLYGIHRSPRFSATTMFGTCLYYRGLNEGGSGSFNNNEFYLNTCIGADRWLGMAEGNDNDVRCNVAISTGAVAGSPSGGTQVDYNAYYDAGNAGEPNKIANSVSTRASSAGYTAGAIVRWSDKANCRNSSDSACFLYKATTSGTAAASSPVPCTALGCTFSDGGVTWQAIRGPYIFYRKLRTAPEVYVVPYAAVHTSADESNSCPSSFADRGGIGINNDTAWTGIFAQDLKGATRTDTPGALQATGGGGAGGQAPYPGQPHAIPGTIQTEDYDLGGEGVAYHDDSAGNSYGDYRTDDVDLYVGNDGPYVADNHGGEWLEYTVEVATAGDYRLELKVASAGAGGTTHIELGGIDKTGPIAIPDTGGWQNWTVVSRTVNLPAGQHILRLAKDMNGSTGYVGNVDHVRFIAVNDGQSPYLGAPHAIPGTIQTEDYDLGGSGIAFYDNSPGNTYGDYRADDVDLYYGNDGPYLADNQAGEWLEYSVDVATAGDYVLELRVASAGGGGAIHIERNDIDKSGSISIPDTGGWQNWTIVTRVVNLDAGRYVLRLAQDTNGSTGYVGNIDYLRFTPASSATGTILRQYWLGIPGDFVTDLTSHPNYPNNPSGSDQLTSLEAPTDWAEDYGTRIRGYIHPPTTGSYTFWIASDDYAELWLSADDNPNTQIRIATVNGWTYPREWNKYPSQQSSPVNLSAGQRYYIEVLHKEGSVLDNIAVGWQLPDGTFEGPIPGARLSPVIP